MEFQSEIVVRYAETDAMGVVYHSNYFTWFDVCRCNILAELGFPYETLEAKGFMSPITNAEITYGTPFRFGETAVIYTRLSRVTPVRTVYSYRVFLKGEDPATAKPRLTANTAHCYVHSDTFKPCSAKKTNPEFYEALKAAEQPEEVLE